MTAGTGDGGAEAKAAESAVYDAGCSASFESDSGSDAASIRTSLEEIAHAAEVALALLTYVCCEEDCDRRMDAGIAQGGSDGEKR